MMRAAALRAGSLVRALRHAARAVLVGRGVALGLAFVMPVASAVPLASAAAAPSPAPANAAPAPESDLIKAPTVLPRTPVPLFVPAEYPMPGAPAAGTYVMRCWQKGRLLFTESNLTEAVVSAIPNKVAAFTEKGARVDAGSATLYVVEVANSLCVIKRA
jgi:hypothetical protein